LILPLPLHVRDVACSNESKANHESVEVPLGL